MAFSILFNDSWGSYEAITTVINALIFQKTQIFLKNMNFLKFTAFSILFNNLWDNYKAISHVNNMLITKKKHKNLKIIHEFLQKFMGFFNLI